METRPVPPESAVAHVDDPRRRLVDQTLKRFQYRPDALIEVLHVAQEAYSFLGEELLGDIARQLKLPESQVLGVATFYHAFALRPKGEHSCIVCTGTACYVKGAGEIVKVLEAAYGIHSGQTTADGRLTLGAARCFGNCSLAPLLVVDDKVLGKETAEGIAGRVAAVLGNGTPRRESTS
ncbi:MAG: NAD(P)H-dependent oxidoreductase subunit E [Desulfuromonadales bacterium]|nr:NAD(P)H-dependent oxidoreductase subunit E [Desulfuromonadales bacterium]